jgi:hypothetical protein
VKDRDDNAAFFGQVTASTTHEIQNVLAIIKENAGLMEDFILMSPNNSPGPNSSGPNSSGLMKNLIKGIEKIKEQAYRGVDLTSGLNAFAHTTDRVCAPVNIYEITKRLIFLAKRFFLQKGIQIVLKDCEKSPSIETDPILFQRVIWMCLECLKETLELKTNIFVRILSPDKRKGIEFYFDEPTLDKGDFNEKLFGTAKWTDLKKTCKETNLTPEPMTQTLAGIRILLD